LSLRGDSTLALALEEHRDALASEVLAREIRSGDLTGPAHREEHALEGEHLALALRKL
jgi:hypothetical protein